MNRDLNGSLNIRQKGMRLFYNAPIPSYLSRVTKKDAENNEIVNKAIDKKIRIIVKKKVTVKQKIRKSRKVIKKVQVANT